MSGSIITVNLTTIDIRLYDRYYSFGMIPAESAWNSTFGQGIHAIMEESVNSKQYSITTPFTATGLYKIAVTANHKFEPYDLYLIAISKPIFIDNSINITLPKLSMYLGVTLTYKMYNPLLSYDSTSEHQTHILPSNDSKYALQNICNPCALGSLNQSNIVIQ